MRALTKATEKLVQPLHLSKFDRLHVSVDKEATHFIFDIFAVSQYIEGKRSFPSNAALNTFIGRIPERKQLDGFHQAAATDVTAMLIDALWPKDQVIFEDDAKIVFDYLLKTCQQQETNVDTYSVLKLHIDLHNRWKREGGDMRMFTIATGYGPKQKMHRKLEVCEEKPLKLYQKVACSNSLASEGYALFMEQGTGKTPVVIARICNEAPAINRKEKRMYRAIICCPKNVRMNWENEFINFATQPGKVTVIRGGELARVKLLIEAMTPEDDCIFTVVIMSYESMVRSWSKLKAIPWDLAVLDEGHYIKWPTTKRSQAAMLLRDKATKRMLLTGSPICNTALDLYSQLEFLGQGFSGFMNWKNFREFYAVYQQTAGGHKALVGMQNLAFMQERLSRLSFIISKSEVLTDLPEKVNDIIEVEMSQEQTEIYNQVRDQLAVEIENDLADDSRPKQMVVQNVLTKLLRLAQITSGFVVWDAEFDPESGEEIPRQIDRIDPNPKIEALVEELKQAGPDSKTIIWACWVQDIKSIAARLKLEGIDGVTYYGGTKDEDRIEAERRFNEDPTCKWFLGNAAAGGTGLNLLGYKPHHGDDYTTNADHTIYFSQGWSSVYRTQSGARNHRTGTRVQVRETDLCVPGTIDEEIRARVLSKLHHAASVADVREIVRSVLAKVYSND